VELRQYRHVLALADHAGFRKASEALGISQPALTNSLFQIERVVVHVAEEEGPSSKNGKVADLVQGVVHEYPS
jgi:hypothetical protein